jgi:hypothetical protein
LYNGLIYLLFRKQQHKHAVTARHTLAYQRFKATCLQETVPGTTAWSLHAFRAALDQRNLNAMTRQEILEGRAAEDLELFIRSRLTQFQSIEDVEALAFPLPIGFLDHSFRFDPALKGLIEMLRADDLHLAYGIEYEQNPAIDAPCDIEGVTPADLAGYRRYGVAWWKLSTYYDELIFLGDSCIFAIANSIRNYCCLEHGTIRVLPFEDTPYARLLTAGYKRAKRVFITNSDYVTAEQRIEFLPGQAIFLPHPFDEQKPRALMMRSRPSKPPRARFFCPARQDWTRNDVKTCKANDRIFQALRILKDNDFSFEAVFTRWGVDLDASMSLSADLGLEDYVRWIEPLSKELLWEEMLNSDAVVDQFLISVISGIGFEALALGRRLITYDDGVTNEAFFGKSPPVLSAQTPTEIVDRMVEVLVDRADVRGVGQRGMRWIDHHHSAKRIVRLQLDGFRRGFPL